MKSDEGFKTCPLSYPQMEAIQRELEEWPRGPAGGFEPVGDIAKRIVERTIRKCAP